MNKRLIISLFTIVLVITGCTSPKLDKSSVGMISVIENSKYNDMLKTLQIGYVLEYEYTVQDDKDSDTEISAELYKNGKLIAEPTSFIIGREANLGTNTFSLLIAHVSEDLSKPSYMKMLLNGASVSASFPPMTLDDGTALGLAWQQTVNETPLQLQNNETYIIGYMIRNNVLKSWYDVNNEDELNEMLNENPYVLLIKLKTTIK